MSLRERVAVEWVENGEACVRFVTGIKKAEHLAKKVNGTIKSFNNWQEVEE
jgi:hypothetical protein